MEYGDTDVASELAKQAKSFMNNVVIPTEQEYLGGGPIPDQVINELREQARDRNVYCPQIEAEYGGLGHTFRDVLPFFEQAGRSLLGPVAMGVNAPDEGNMHILELVGTKRQKEEWLIPLVAGESKSAFAMTEPNPGAGSDPKMMKTQATKDGDEWIIEGHKWWTTQGSEADIFIVMARTDMDAHPYSGTSLFLVPANTEGITIVRDIPHLGPDLIRETHTEIRFNDVRIPEENLLGELNEGFIHAQQRLVPARLTHCMRYTGMAMRAIEVAKAYMNQREAFDENLADKQAQRFAIADLETQLYATRVMVRQAARAITENGEARVPVSMSKVFAASTCQDAIDFAIQACGGAGMSHDLPLADFYKSVRQFRLVDGADEVHRRVIAREAFESVGDPAIENLPTF